MTEDEAKKLIKDVADLKVFMNSLRSSTTLPLEVGAALKKRIGTAPLSMSSKGATSENKAVNESGAASYSVMDKPDGFTEINIGGTVIYIPFFS